MLVEAIVFFLSVSLLFYALFAGADFGAGVLELLRGRRYRDEQQEVISHAIAPVWEANHVWLILAVVILFNGFPRAYAAISTTFHIPITAMLIGIVLRGCAFTFRNYDAVHDSSHRLYTGIFALSSFLTPFMIGMVAGGVTLGEIPPHGGTFYSLYVSPWFNPFCASMGLFTCLLSTFLAAVYLIGETEEAHIRAIFARRAQILNAGIVLAGALVIGTAEMRGFPLISIFASDPVLLLCVLAATLGIFPLWRALGNGEVKRARVAAAAQITFVLLGWFRIQFPALLNSRWGGPEFTIYNAAAPEATLQMLLYALIGGSCVIFPALYLLLRTFKRY